MITCASIMAYIGDCSRFYSAKQLRNYVGLVPIIDQSGDHNWQGGTTSFGCLPVRRNIVSDHVNQPKERSGKITKYCVHVF